MQIHKLSYNNHNRLRVHRGNYQRRINKHENKE